MAKAKKNRPVPTYGGVEFGPDERHKMCVWLADSDEPTPVLISYHAGGFQERRIPDLTTPPPEVLKVLGHGISVVVPTYRHTAPNAFIDAARALQFVRTKTSEWNLDGERIAATGNSSGGCLSLWLAYHDDLAKPRAKDPILRQSTRLVCAAVTQAVTSIDLRFVRELMPGCAAYRNFEETFEISADNLDQLPSGKYELMEEYSPINHVSKEAPPTLLTYNRGLDAPFGVHHAVFGKALKERADAVGAPCDLVAGGKPLAGSQKKTITAFVKDILNGYSAPTANDLKHELSGC